MLHSTPQFGETATSLVPRQYIWRSLFAKLEGTDQHACFSLQFLLGLPGRWRDIAISHKTQSKASGHSLFKAFPTLPPWQLSSEEVSKCLLRAAWPNRPKAKDGWMCFSGRALRTFWNKGMTAIVRGLCRVCTHMLIANIYYLCSVLMLCNAIQTSNFRLPLAVQSARF